MKISLNQKSYTISLDGGKPITAQIAVSRNGEAPVTAENLILKDDGLTITGTTPYGAVTVSFAQSNDGDKDAVAISGAIEISEAARKIALSPFYGATFENAAHLFTHGRTMGNCTTTTLPAEVLSTVPGEEVGTSFISYFQTIISFADTKLHLTTPLRQTHITTATGVTDGTTIKNVAITTLFEFPEAGTYTTPVSNVAWVEDGYKALCDYGDLQVTEPLPKEPQPIGWNSWDYYRWTITEEEVLKNAEFMAADPVLSKYIKRIIVDDGWQYCYGEWDANPLFPSGMPALASNLRKMGFTPGLWIAPLIAEPHSRIAQWDTDMLAMSEGGDPCIAYECMKRFGFILDPTVEKCQKFWHDLFTRYAGYGYGYFKIDFLMPLFNAPRFHDNTVPRGELMRKVITPITNAVRGRAEILGCGYAYEAGCDMIKMVRAGGDIHATWNNAKHNAVSVAARSWASNRLWVTDPDFCVCRGPETVNDPDRGRLQCLYIAVNPDTESRYAWGNTPWSEGFDSILAKEAECLLAIALINGGAINLSDKVYRLNDRGLDLVRRTVSAERGFAGIPLDLFESNIASKWIQKTPSGFRVLVVNWTDETKEFSLDYGKLGYNASEARNFWTDERVIFRGNVVRTVLSPHTCGFYEFVK